MQGRHEKIKQLKQACKHAEPNYGVLWFYFKASVVENAVEVWQRATEMFEHELESGNGELWIGSKELIRLLRSGLCDATFDQQCRIVYGFE